MLVQAYCGERHTVLLGSAYRNTESENKNSGFPEKAPIQVGVADEYTDERFKPWLCGYLWVAFVMDVRACK
jgi:hypothetical protein